jgi:hypothetical protein
VPELTQYKEWGNNYYTTKEIQTGEAKNTETFINYSKNLKERYWNDQKLWSWMGNQ